MVDPIGHDTPESRQLGRAERKEADGPFRGGLANVSCRWLAGVNGKTEITNS